MADFSARHTLDVEHRRRMQALKERTDAAPESPDMRERLADLSSPDIGVRLAARIAVADALKAAKAVGKGRARPKMDDELKYMIRAGPVLMKYYDIQDAPDDTSRAQIASKTSILRYFMPPGDRDDTSTGAKAQLLKEYERATCKVSDGGEGDPAPERCKCCGAIGQLQVVTAEAIRVCRACDAFEPVVVETERPPSKDTVKDSVTFCYKRLNHFNEWLSQIQGKQQTNIPDDVYDAILLELKKRKITNLSDLTAKQVKEILKKLKFNKWYEHVTFILNKLTGRQPQTLHPDLEEKLRVMFKMIQAPFIKHAPRARANFLSYSYVLNKLVRLLGHDELLPSFPLLKSREKLAAMESCFKLICADLKWPFIPSM